MLNISDEQITSGRLDYAIVLLTIPLFAQKLVTIVLSVVDLYWLGRLGGTAVAAVGLASPILGFFLATCIATPFVGTQVLVSRQIGEGNRSDVYQTTFTGVTIALVFGIVGGSVLFFLGGDIVGVLTSIQPQQSATEVSQLATAYLRVMGVGVVAAALADTIEGAFVGLGDTRVGLYADATTVIVNAILDPVLIFGWGPAPELGIRGAALATVFGYVFALLLGAVFILTERSGGVLSWEGIEVDRTRYRELLDVGLPLSAQHGVRHVGRITFIVIVFVLGGAAGLTAYHVVTRISSLATAPAKGLKTATQSVVGQNLGAGSPSRANSAVWIGFGISAIVMLFAAVTQLLIPELLITTFVPELETESLGLSVQYLRIFAYSYLAVGAIQIFQGGFNAAERSRISLLSSLLQYWGIRIPLVGVGVYFLGQSVLIAFWSVALSKIVVAVGLGSYYVHARRDGMLARVTGS